MAVPLLVQPRVTATGNVQSLREGAFQRLLSNLKQPGMFLPTELNLRASPTHVSCYTTQPFISGGEPFLE
jgi:hypothetical protein